MMDDIILRLSNISKQFPGVLALDDVSFELKKGEIHAICGENGSGKSTLLKILNGTYTVYEGQIGIEGKPVTFANTREARNAGISVIPQEIQMALDLSVAENIYMGMYPKTRAGLVDWKKMVADTGQLQAYFGSNIADIDPQTKVSQLSMGKRQILEIFKAISFDINILALDEPTSSLSEQETAQLFQVLRELTAKGVSIIYVSHKLKEIFELCDRISVLKDGKYMGTKEIRQTNMGEVIHMMVGRNFELFGEKNISNTATDDTVLKVENLSRTGVFSNISFELKKGEVLGMFGIIGSGRTEVARTIFGVDRKKTGTITLNGKEVDIQTPEIAVKHRMGFITEDRHAEGLVLGADIKTNITMTILKRLKDGLALNVKREAEVAEQFKTKLRVKAPDIHFIANNMSGGNQQKTVLAKWLASDSDVLIFDEPTRGIDVGAKSEIYQWIHLLANEGVGIILISSEILEVLNLCNRILVFSDGHITGKLDNTSDLREEDIMKYAV